MKQAIADERMTAARTPSDEAGWMRVFALACTMSLTVVASALSYRRPLWLDEAYTYFFATAPWPAFQLAIAHADGAIAPYYVAMRYWIAIAGASPAALRIPSIFFSACSAVVVYRIAVRLFDNRTAAGTVGLFVCNALWLTYAIDARAYALALFLALWSTLAFLDLGDGRRPVVGALVYALAIALTYGAHEVIGLLVFAGHAVSAPFFLPAPRTVRRDLLLAVVLTAVLCAAETIVLRRLGPTFSNWIPSPTPSGIFALLVSVAGRKFALPLVLVFSGAALLAGYREKQRAIAIVASWLIGSFATAYVVSVVFHSIWLDRYFISAMPSLMMLTAAGIARLPNRIVQATVLVLLMVLEFGPVITAIRVPTERWTSVASLLHDRVGTRDIIYFYWPSAEVPYQAAAAETKSYPGTSVTLFPVDPASAWRMPWQDAVRRIEISCSVIMSHPHLWLVAYSGPAPSAALTDVETAFGRFYETKTIEQSGVVTVTEFTSPQKCLSNKSLP